MDFIFLFTGMICLGEAVFMFLGKDMLIFNGTTFKQKDYDMKRLSRVEGVLFLVDAAAVWHWGRFNWRWDIRWSVSVSCLLRFCFTEGISAAGNIR